MLTLAVVEAKRTLDRTATPSGLRLRVGLRLYQADDVGLAHIYPLAGSFVAFLSEARGLARFRWRAAHCAHRRMDRR
jgi:hypothetical protein